MSAPVSRERAEAIVETIAAFVQFGSACADGEEAARIAASLEVPVGVVWMGLDLMAVDEIDALVAWWPAGTRKGAG